MDIKRAKQEIKNSIEAYLKKDAFGEYLIPVMNQRPIFLMGPPGIGKTQIMEQIAKECQIGLVAYTITHHTRQSAVGLPFIKEKTFGEKQYSVTEYTMSEIIASVYEKMEQTGLAEGILFIDEINCVSETLAPTMLQFLQCKTFGNQKIPEGWMIVAAGNPPEYNRSVREFDVVTLDRIKKIDVEENFDVWKEYAYKANVHPAVISYLELKKNHFYRIETTVDGKMFATARGWEDLSKLIQVYEMLGKEIDRDVVYQYIQHLKIAKDFANYLELFHKYQKDYGIEDILRGHWTKETLDNLKVAAFDERLSVVSLLNSRLSENFRRCFDTDLYVTKLYEFLLRYKETLDLDLILYQAADELEQQKKSELITRAEEQTAKAVIQKLESYRNLIKGEHLAGEDAFAKVKKEFAKETAARGVEIDETSEMLTNTFDFMEEAFGDSQEMVVFVTELNANYYSIQFIKENGCDQYYRYNKGLLFDERQEKILKRMEEVEGKLGT